jgi:putative endopeptidase
MTLPATDRDPSADPGADFYRFANGGWLDANPIPPGYGAWGSFEEVSRRNEVVLRELLERAAAAPENELDRLLGDAFAAGLDLEAIERAGTAPVAPLLESIDAHDVAAVLPELHRSGIFAFFGIDVTADHDDSTRNLLWLTQPRLGLPDRESYFDEGAAELRAAYVEHVAAQLANVGAEGDAAKILALETRLAELHLKAEDRRDPDKTHNRRDRAAIEALLPGYLDALGASAAGTVNVENPALLEGFQALLDDTAAVRAYLKFTVVRTLADALERRIDGEDFAFYGRRIRGQQEPHERVKRVIDAIGEDLGEALAQRYVERTFPPEAKQRAQRMVEAILEEMRASLKTRAWMSDETRARGEAKLDAMRVKIGYPDEWRDWSGLEIARDGYAANRLNAARFEIARRLAKLGQPVDRGEWELPAHIVNAYYHPILNEIVFPAGILQPPLFDARADDAVNFGAIGMVVAHEVTHGFDDQGRRYDEHGHLRDWWNTGDEARFKALADRLVAQFDAYTVLDDVHVNGRLTLGENIADLGGLRLAERALARVSADAPAVDGLTPAQRFFLSYATLWRANVNPELQRTLAGIDPHSPRHLRVLGPISNLDSFRDAFRLADDAPIMRPPRERIEIW